MAVQINEVIVRAIITGDDNNHKKTAAAHIAVPDTVSSVTKDELLELIDEVFNDKKER